MGKANVLINRGLYGSVNPYQAPEGALDIAQNVFVDDAQVLEGRDGYQIEADEHITAEPLKFKGSKLLFKGEPILFDVRNLFNVKKILLDSDRNLNIFTTDDEVVVQKDKGLSVEKEDIPIGAVFSHNNIGNQTLFNSATRMWQKKDGKFLRNGLTPCVVPYVELEDMQEGKWQIGGNKKISVRVTYFSEDLLVESAPSDVAVITNNEAVSKTIKLTFTLPIDAHKAGTLKMLVYRTDAVGVGVATGDNMFFVGEQSLSDDFTAEELYITPQENMSRKLYTNSNRSGIQNSNYPPPYSTAVVSHKGLTAYGGIKANYSLNFRFPKNFTPYEGGRVQLVNGDTQIWFKIISSAQVAHRDTNSLSALLIDHMFVSSDAFWVLASFLHTAKDFYGYSLFDEIENETIFRFEALSETMPKLVGTNDVGNDFVNALGGVDGTLSFKREEEKARVYFSILNKSECVPLYRFLTVGSSDKAIIGMIVYRDDLYVFKEDGIFIISGTGYENLTVRAFLSEIILTSPDSLKSFGDSIFALTNQGVVRVTPSGYKKISTPINHLIDNDYPNAFAILNYRNRQYLLNMNGRLLSYGLQNGEWTTIDRDFQDGVEEEGNYYVANPTNVLKLRDITGNPLERKIDEAYPVKPIQNHSEDNDGRLYVVRYKNYSIEAGQFVIHSKESSLITGVEELTSGGYALDLEGSIEHLNDTTEDIRIANGIKVKFATKRLHMGMVEQQKMLNDVYLFFETEGARDIEVFFKTNHNDKEVGIKNTFENSLAFGEDDFGVQLWGGISVVSNTIRLFPPREQSQFSWVSIGAKTNSPFAYIRLYNIHLEYDSLPQRILN